MCTYKLYIKLIIFLAILSIEQMGSSQTIATFVAEAGSYNRLNTPVYINLDKITNLPDLNKYLTREYRKGWEL